MVMADIVSSILIFFQMCFILSLFFLIVRNIVLNCFNPVCFIKLIISCIGMGGGYHLIKKLVKRDKKIFCVKKFIKVWTPKSVVGVMFMFFFISLHFYNIFDKQIVHCMWLYVLFIERRK